MILKGELTHHGILREEAGYFIIRQSMPYPLAENNVFLTESSEGWSVIDIGVDLPRTREVWEKALQEIGISFRHINQIYITHCHPDHLGAARWLQQMAEAPVFMLEEEIRRANDFMFFTADFAESYRKAIETECRRQSFSDALVDELIRSWRDDVTPLFPRPELMVPLVGGQTIDLRGEKFEIIPTPVHADGQFLLWNEKLNHLFIADFIAANSYIHFSDWPHTRRSNLLSSLFEDIERLLSFGEPRVFPGHGESFNDLPRRLQVLRQRHLRRLDKVRQLVRSEVTVGELYPQLYELVDYVHLDRIAAGETLGYLEYLDYMGELQKSDQGDRVTFRR
ncbi:MAG: MBL fold metallo-hydrolase [Syntrophomonadaceae bacterium]|nr:MBL fold metallo-hydrolase [Syntrophomonadaceae bacterium]